MQKCFENVYSTFFATNETGIVNKNDMSHYIENKAKNPLELISLKHRDTYKTALSEIEKLLEAVGLRDREGSTMATKSVNRYPF